MGSRGPGDGHVFVAALAVSLAAHAATLALWPPRPHTVGEPQPLTVKLVGVRKEAAADARPTLPEPARAASPAASLTPRRADAAKPETGRAETPKATRSGPAESVSSSVSTASSPVTGGGGTTASAAKHEAATGQAGGTGEPGEDAPTTPARYRADYLTNPPPAYPERSRELGEEGRVEVRVRVTVDGRPAEVQLARSSGYKRLDDAALKAVAHWRFVPARRGDTHVEAWLIVPMPFRLDDAR
ncbi:energy transducer TonB [Crenobacter cavernae]|uniref:Energy transducer TonB n=1 Tax=Crenobacter cavernae TaxID=2290923 RepID=A0A345Y3D4_9NEIS|nr:energy transducer TonB [Crenobacter cavernae]AXK38436.1 energy transducer TonB [Crenobacter cavernae]